MVLKTPAKIIFFIHVKCSDQLVHISINTYRSLKTIFYRYKLVPLVLESNGENYLLACLTSLSTIYFIFFLYLLKY